MSERCYSGGFGGRSPFLTISDFSTRQVGLTEASKRAEQWDAHEITLNI